MNSRIVLALLIVILTHRLIAQTPAQVGDVFVGECDGTQIGTDFEATEVLTPTGQGVNEFDGGDNLSLCMTGMTFDAVGNSYIIGSFPYQGPGENIFEFDSLGNQIGGFAPPTETQWYSIVHDQQGNFYISEGNFGVQETDPNGNPLSTFTVDGGAGWTTLAADQHTLVYSSLNGGVESYDTVTQTQGQELVPMAGVWTVRLLPDNSLLVLSGGSVTRWAAPCSGCYPYRQISSYALPASAAGLALDPDGVSFWTVSPYWYEEEGTANVYRLNIKTGKLMTTFNVGSLPYGRFYYGSIGIDGDGMNSTAKYRAGVKFSPQPVGTTSRPKSVSIKNIGQVEMTVSNLTISGDFGINENLCANGIRPGTHCNVFVQFTPTQLGSRSGTLLIYDNATNSPQIISLSGNGVTN